MTTLLYLPARRRYTSPPHRVGVMLACATHLGEVTHG